MRTILLLLALVSLCGCSGNSTTKKHGNKVESYSGSSSSSHAGVVIALQPMGNFTQKETNALKNELETKLSPMVPEGIIIEVLPNKPLPDSTYYKPRNRYWADKLLCSLDVPNKDKHFKKIALTHKDISKSIHGYYNYGIMGLSTIGGSRAVVSTYRIKDKRNLWKVVAHEFFHSCGLPHCPKDNPTCIIQDAHQKDTFNKKNHLCKDCQAKLQRILDEP